MSKYVRCVDARNYDWLRERGVYEVVVDDHPMFYGTLRRKDGTETGGHRKSRFVDEPPPAKKITVGYALRNAHDKGNPKLGFSYMAPHYNWQDCPFVWATKEEALKERTLRVYAGKTVLVRITRVV